ncbi:MAG: DUF1080 domain-containing protein [Planctomycetota bacterium]|nr:DUF1080 domain-containing protein [Planctomycetota bacterium]
MKLSMKCLALSVLIVTIPVLAVHAQNQPPKGFTAVFNGKDLSGWKGLAGKGGSPENRAKMTPEELAKDQAAADKLMNAHWSVQDGVLVFDGKGKSLCTAKDYRDFEMYVDWKIKEKGDSGIYLRGSPQVQIWDYKLNNIGSGGLYNNKKNPSKPTVLADKPVGEWNTFYIRMIGEHVHIKLNGKTVADDVVLENYWNRKRPIYPTGQIELQNHGNTLYFRNVFVREIPSEEANIILAANKAGFVSAFNGKDLSGWAGPVQNYEIFDGARGCQKGTGGTIYTQNKYSDFVARFEFKLPPGGNNGLAIRYPGKGDTAYVGMCELQVLDSEHPKYARLDARQYHGSAYGMVPAHRGYLRPTGEWNYQQVTVKGSTIKVELNGTTILDADLSKVTEFMGKRPHPGKDNKEGHFGFAGHGDAVHFRNVSIKQLGK